MSVGWGFVNRPSYTVCGVSSHAVGDSEWGGASVRKAMREAADSNDPKVWVANGNAEGRKMNGDVRITPEEAAALQSYPADFRWEGAKTKRYLQIGNAVPPLLAQAVLSALWAPTIEDDLERAA